MVDVEASYFDEVKTEYINRRNTLVEGLNKIEGVVCPTPGGAFYTTVQLPVNDTDKFCQWLLESFSHQNETVMLAPASGFYATKGLGKNQVRIAYVLNEKDLGRCLEILEVALEEYDD